MNVRLVIAHTIEAADIPTEAKVAGVDTVHIESDQLGIEAVRALKQSVFEAPVNAPQRHFVLVLKTATVEAQNALLKLFEEPPAHAVFHFVVPHESVLIPTLRSRFVQVAGTDTASLQEATDFLAGSYKERLAVIADKAKAKDRAWMERMVPALGRVLQSTSSTTSDGKAALLLADTYIRTRGASKKMLLEELALSLPITK